MMTREHLKQVVREIINDTLEQVRTIDESVEVILENVDEYKKA